MLRQDSVAHIKASDLHVSTPGPCVKLEGLDHSRSPGVRPTPVVSSYLKLCHSTGSTVIQGEVR
jgi:hypothetical protein